MLVTNDDGPFSPGLWALVEAVESAGEEPLIVVPFKPRSASGFTVTLHKPLRLHKVEMHGRAVYITNGSPCDAVVLAARLLAPEGLRIVLSGVNIGPNVSLQATLASGTVAAAVQAVFLGVPAVAISVDASNEKSTKEALGANKGLLEALVSTAIRESPPADFININLPRSRARDLLPAEPDWMVCEELVEARVDRFGNPYYWLYCGEVEASPGTDVDLLRRGFAVATGYRVAGRRGVEVDNSQELVAWLESVKRAWSGR